ncbi:MAG TPA: divalent metal cation transporter, partial [Acidimicrobiales bacterium]|nr:divalent metal cation transporter [Acidimicrobiales bacterium]
LGRTLGHATGTLFALILLNASIIGAASVTLATSYAFGDMFGVRHSLHRRVREAKVFYVSFSGIVAAAAGIVLIPHAPLGLITTAVQALAGILLPSATVFLLLLCNDRAVLGPWTNRPWLNALATVIVSVLLVLSLILMTTTVFPNVNVPLLLGVLAGVLVVVLGVSGALYARAVARRPAPAAGGEQRREGWRMPPIALLEPAPASTGRKAALSVMYGYLVLSVAMLLVKAIQLGLHK